MTPQDAMLAATEVAIGLAGFSGLVAAFAQRKDARWGGNQRTRIIILVVLCFAIIASAIAPFALGDLSRNPAIVWGLPMCLYGLTIIGVHAAWLRSGYRFQLRLVGPFFFWLSAATHLVVLCSGLGLLVPYSPAILLLGYLTNLVMGSLIFLGMLVIAWHQVEE